MAVSACSIVEGVDVLGHIRQRKLTVLVNVFLDSLLLQATEEGLDDGTVSAVALAAHARLKVIGTTEAPASSRQVLVRLRQGDSDRDIARSRLVGRPEAAAFRALAVAQGWLDPAAPLPDDAAIAAAVRRARRARSTISSADMR